MKLTVENITLPQSYSIPPDAVAFRDGLVMESGGIMAVTDAVTQNHATAVAREIQAHLGDVEAARVALTAPLLEAQRKLMDLKKAHCGPLVTEKDRLGELVSAFQLAERERVAEQEAARLAEIDWLEQQRLAAISASATAAHAANAAQCEESQAQADIAAADALQAQEQIEAERRAVIVAPLPEVQKASGARTKTELDFEVLDIKALYAARPELCKPPEAKRSAIKATCTVNSKIPGIRFFETVSTDFRR